MSAKTADSLVARFIESVNAGHRDRMPVEEVPVPCRRDLDDDSCDWQIVSSPEAGWLQELEERARVKLPSSFKRLVGWNLFPSFVRGRIRFYAVGLPEGSLSCGSFELRAAARNDLSDVLVTLGVVPFARPHTGSYDPICFDFRGRPTGDSQPVIRIDHEEVIIRKRLKVTEVVAPSFAALLHDLS